MRDWKAIIKNKHKALPNIYNNIKNTLETIVKLLRGVTLDICIFTFAGEGNSGSRNVQYTFLAGVNFLFLFTKIFDMPG